MATLTRKQILDADDLATATVSVAEWGGEVIVRTLTAAERDQLEGAIISESGVKDMDNLRAKLVALAVVDDDGKRLFTFADVAALGKKSASALGVVFTAAARLSGITKKDVEDLTENLSIGQSDNSISG